MFLQDGSISSDKSFKGLGGLLNDLKDASLEALNPKSLATKYLEIEDLTRQTTKNISGMFGESAKVLQEVSVASYLRTVEIGASYKDQLEIQQEIAIQQQKALNLSEEQVVTAIQFSKATGISVKEVGSLVLAFADLGQSTDTALESMSKMSAEARKYGLNVGQFMSTVAKNLTLVNSYGFKNGVEGFTKMVARAQALRIDMAQTTKLAEKLLNPEDAIELASKFQMLGGAIGDLGDPFKLIYMAQNDMGGLQESVIKAAQSAVMFNKETGEFKISTTEMYRLRAQAEALNMSYEDLSNTAIKAAKESEILTQLRFTGLNEETKQLVANLGEIQNGKIQVQLPGIDKAITDLSLLEEDKSKKLDDQTKEFQALKAFQNNVALSDRQIAEGQLSTLKNIEIGLERTRNLVVSTPEFQKAGQQASDALKKGFDDFTNEIKEVAQSPEYRAALNATAETISEGFKDILGQLKTGDLGGATDALANMGKGLLETTGILDVVNDGLKKLGKNLIPDFNPKPIKEGEDMLLGPSQNTVVSVPQGTFKLNEKDSIIAGTNLFDKGQSQVQKLEFANSAEVRVGGNIQISGLPSGAMSDMLLRDPDFVAGIKNLFSKSFKEQLGTA